MQAMRINDALMEYHQEKKHRSRFLRRRCNGMLLQISITITVIMTAPSETIIPPPITLIK